MSILGFSIGGNSKTIFIFHFRVTPMPPGEVWGAIRGTPSRIMCYVNSGVFISGESKNAHDFHFRVPPSPTRAPLGGWRGYTTINMSILEFSIAVNSKIIFIFRVTPPRKGALGGGEGTKGGIPPLIMCYIIFGPPTIEIPRFDIANYF